MHGTITPLDRAKSSATYQKLHSEFNTTLIRFVETGFLHLVDPKIDPNADMTTRRRQYRVLRHRSVLPESSQARRLTPTRYPHK